MALELDHVSKAFRARQVITDLSLAAAPGEIVVVIGPSGAGKTVLLRLVAGIEEADSGRIRIAGRDVTDEPPDARGVGMAFQNFALFPHMSAFDNVASALTARNGHAATIAERVQRIARLLKIDHVLAHSPRELSNGQKQRTALARALVGEPPVLLLDDPLRNVDAKLRYEMRLELPLLLKRFGSAVLYVTQDYKEAMALGDRIAVLIDGHLAQVAPPAEVYEAPATTAVARLLGDPAINLLPVEPVANGHGTSILIANHRVAIGEGYRHAAGTPCILGLRPEAIRLHEAPVGGSFPVWILAETPLNEKTVFLMHADDGTELLASMPSDGVAAGLHGPAHASFAPEAAHLFARADGRRLARSGS
jgi:multiple sugar transport system ATP-binding protein